MHRKQHYEIVMGIFFEAAKQFWLRSPSVELEGEGWDQDLLLRRKLCGFYLVYMLYGKQPIHNYSKIPMTLHDMNRATEFLNQVIPNIDEELAKEIVFMNRCLYAWKAWNLVAKENEVGYRSLFFNRIWNPSTKRSILF